MVGWHHQINGNEPEQTPGDGEGQESLVCCSPWGCRVRHDLATEQQQQYLLVDGSIWLNLKFRQTLCFQWLLRSTKRRGYPSPYFLRFVYWKIFISSSRIQDKGPLINYMLNPGSREGSGTPLQYSCLESPMDGGAWWAAVYGVAQSQTRLSNWTEQNWCWSWSSNTLASWWEEPTHWKRPWCWETLRAGGEGGNKGWNG